MSSDEQLRPDPTPPLGEESFDQGKTTSKYGLFELLLDPRGLQMLMLAGGGLLALGLVLWLAVIGVFDQPINAAIGLGVANLSLLAAGIGLAVKTRYRLAGRATAMLACLLMPLNLWFYDAQGLLTLSGGGNLWLAAFVCCVLYAGVARLLRDSLFVYAFAAGVSMTGLLFLADGDVGHFWEVLAPSTLLVCLGVACIHAERLFPAESADGADGAESVFTREDFGLAFFRAGHALLASGLVVLLAGRLTGRFYDTVVHVYGWVERPDVATLLHVKLAALGLTLLGAYAYGYSQLSAGRGKRYTFFAVLTLVWGGVIGIDLLGIEFTEVLATCLLGVFAIGCRLAMTALPESGEEEAARTPSRMLGTASRVASLAGVAAILVQLARGIWLPGGEALGFTFTWAYVLSAILLLVAEALAIRTRVVDGNRTGESILSGLAALAVLGGSVSLLATAPAAPLLAMTALLLAGSVASFICTNDRVRSEWVPSIEAGGVLIAVLLVPCMLFDPTLATVTATVGVALAYGVLGLLGKRYAFFAALLLTLAAGCQATVLYQLGVHVPLLTLSAASVVALVAGAWAQRNEIEVAGRVSLLLAATAGGLLAANRLLAGEADGVLLSMIVGQTALTGVGILLTKRTENRSVLLGVGVVQVLVTGLVLNAVSVLTLGQRVEVFSTVVGLGLVAAGLIGWRREAGTADGETDRLTDTNLWVGSLLATVPLTCGLIATRLFGGAPAWIATHEIGVLAIGLGLVGVGTLCRLRATTLAGSGALAIYLVSLLTLLHIPDQLQSVAVYLIVGGAILFGGAVLLSVYRDRLLTIPGRVRDGDGVFAVLKWR